MCRPCHAPGVLASIDQAEELFSAIPTAAAIVELDDEALAFLNATAQRVHAIKQRERRRRAIARGMIAEIGKVRDQAPWRPLHLGVATR